ncbi:hypothetical protein V6Z11_D13G175000 [Gossypium hirsutum]
MVHYMVRYLYFLLSTQHPMTIPNSMLVAYFFLFLGMYLG